jgi:RNase P subunit RPR2
MAIEVIKRGKIPPERQYRMTCKKCTSVLQFKESDGLHLPGEYHLHDSWQIICPVCQTQLFATAANRINADE